MTLLCTAPFDQWVLAYVQREKAWLPVKRGQSKGMTTWRIKYAPRKSYISLTAPKHFMEIAEC